MRERRSPRDCARRAWSPPASAPSTTGYRIPAREPGPRVLCGKLPRRRAPSLCSLACGTPLAQRHGHVGRVDRVQLVWDHTEFCQERFHPAFAFCGRHGHVSLTSVASALQLHVPYPPAQPRKRLTQACVRVAVPGLPDTPHAPSAPHTCGYQILIRVEIT